MSRCVDNKNKKVVLVRYWILGILAARYDRGWGTPQTHYAEHLNSKPQHRILLRPYAAKRPVNLRSGDRTTSKTILEEAPAKAKRLRNGGITTKCPSKNPCNKNTYAMTKIPYQENSRFLYNIIYWKIRRVCSLKRKRLETEHCRQIAAKKTKTKVYKTSKQTDKIKTYKMPPPPKRIDKTTSPYIRHEKNQNKRRQYRKQQKDLQIKTAHTQHNANKKPQNTA